MIVYASPHFRFVFDDPEPERDPVAERREELTGLALSLAEHNERIVTLVDDREISNERETIEALEEAMRRLLTAGR